ncbi:hypothetical protein B0H14DRAFT_3482501 [Mycena olivaceomarginata]|nr:hypothetical protein B0H14DRAFT_3482501 [Mycena olivaceomarginata]
MSRRPSALSVSLPAPLANGTVKAVQSPTAPEAPAPTRRPSVSKLPTDISELDPDELFTKYTVAEVKFAQQRLRADADAKQEELRLMLRERYRDLLQASTSIIDIARSSKRVIEALQETKDAILSQEEASHAPTNLWSWRRRCTFAHITTTLRAPKAALGRARIFLAGMVHRALDKPDEETWSAQGLDVMEQFPLAQRQWDAVSQFRSQIVHKATLSLREYTASTEDACAAILTLHFLDRRPLTETLSVFLSQRSKTLLAMLSRTAEPSPISPLSASLSRRANGHIPEKRPAPSTARKTSVREVKEATQAALDAMVKTLTTARTPPRPSSNTMHFRSVLDEWFQTSNQSLKVAASKWFSDLHSVAEVWTLRSSIRQWIDASGLRPDEATTLKLIFGDAAQQRVLSIWKLALSNAEDAFQLQLAAATASLRETPREQRKDASPVDFLFTAPPLPVFPGLGPVDSSFQKYKASLRRYSGTFLSCWAESDEEARGVVAQLSEDYRPNAEALCIGILDTLSSAEKQDADDSDLSIDSLVFVGHVAEELGSSSPFVSSIGGSAEVVQAQFKISDSREVEQVKTPRPAKLFVSSSISGSEMGGSKLAGKHCAILLSFAALQIFALLNGKTCASSLIPRRNATESSYNKRSHRHLRMDGTMGRPDYLARTQTLFAVLLPPQSPMRPLNSADKFAPLLPWGSPALDQQFQPAVELAKASSRFGLLLVGTSAR